MSDFKAGWWRYWMTFALPWSSIAGFALAAIVSSFVADAVIETVKVVVGWNR